MDNHDMLSLAHFSLKRINVRIKIDTPNSLSFQEFELVYFSNN